jgi:hypothetical protein
MVIMLSEHGEKRDYDRSCTQPHRKENANLKFAKMREGLKSRWRTRQSGSITSLDFSMMTQPLG